MTDRPRRIYLAGHTGMVGSAILRRLEARIAAGEALEVLTRARRDLDLTDQAAVRRFLKLARPDAVILAAARVGGIHANDSQPADFIADNLSIALNVVTAAHEAGVQRLLNLGSSCIYPRMAPQPIPEDALLTGLLEPTNEPYAIAKIAALKLCESLNRQHGRDYRSVMPCNLYGPGDTFHPERAHVLPALMRRFHEAAQRGDGAVTVWGTGTPLREFLHVDDMAEGALHVLDLPRERLAAETRPMVSHINLGSGQEISIAELARMIAGVTGFTGELRFDPGRPDGTPRKVLDVSRLARLGWQARIGLEQGLRDTYAWYLAQDPARLRQ